jgi:CheY-like chemotaxis protein
MTGEVRAFLGNVLIVEDDRDTREMLATLLAMEGFHTVAAEDGLEALHLLRTVRHRAPEVPCLVLLDLKMPRLGGSEFRRAQLGRPHGRQRPGGRDVGDRRLSRRTPRPWARSPASANQSIVMR